MACWDLSWLLDRDTRHGAFASLEKVLDETQQRGFNASRYSLPDWNDDRYLYGHRYSRLCFR